MPGPHRFIGEPDAEFCRLCGCMREVAADAFYSCPNGIDTGRELGMPTHIRFDPDRYDELLEDKCAKLQAMFAPFLAPEMRSQPIDVCPSDRRYFRMKVRFDLLRLDDGKFACAFWERGQTTEPLYDFPVVGEGACRLRPILLEELEHVPDVLALNLCALHFLCTTDGDVLVTMRYSEPVDCDAWETAARALRDVLSARYGREIALLCKAKGQRIPVLRDYVIERFVLSDGRELVYKQVEGSFSNPNGNVNKRALEWLGSVSAGICKSLAARRNQPLDAPPAANLLELYCGNANHTVALAPKFSQVVAVELDKPLCMVARDNLAANGISNVKVVQVDSHDFCLRMLRKKAFTPTEGGPAVKFDAVLVDPPRRGLDSETLRLIKSFDHIIYISCLPDNLLRDIVDDGASGSPSLAETHHVARLCLCDQFAYTRHMEAAVYLQRKSPSTQRS